MTEPGEYLLVTASIVLPLIAAVMMLLRVVLRYYQVGIGIVDLPFF